jgi:putative ABC transport system permease protein
MDALVNDFRYALRSLRRTPGFTITATLTLAIGIGANTAIFSMMDHVMLRPLAYQDPDRLYVIHENVPRFAHISPTLPVSANHFLEWQRHTNAFEEMALIGRTSLNLTGAGEPEQLQGARASAALFPMLGIRPQLGRVFLTEEDAIGRDRVVILDDALWRRRFGADAGIVGRTIALSGNSYTVIGVLPSDFRFPKIADLFGMTVYEGRPQFWKPLAMTKDEATQAETFDFISIARLKETSSRAAALDQLNHVQASVSKWFAGSDLRAVMTPLDEQITGRSKAGLQMLLAAVGAVLLIGCVNITNLMLARSTQRRREIAVRSAIGASSTRLLRQALAESTMLAVVGTLGGLVLAHVVLQTVLAYAPIDLPRMDEVRLDGRIFAFMAVLGAFTSLACGLLPAWHFANADPQDAMKSHSRTSTSGHAAGRLRSSLVASEVALSAICLVAAGLLLHSFVKIMRVDPGFTSERVVTVDVALPAVRYPAPKRVEFYRTLLSEVSALPGVVSAGITNKLPVAGRGTAATALIHIEGATAPIIERPIADVRNVNPEFFSTMGIGLRAGSILSASDRDGTTAVISQSLADRAWPNQQPLGKRFHIGSPQSSPLYEVVGVVGDVRHTSLIGNQHNLGVYIPYWRRAFSEISLAVKTTDDPAATYAIVRQTIRRLDSELPIAAMRTMDDVVLESVAPRQFQMRLVLVFGIIALFLAGLGVYGVVSYSVAQRTSELGLRMALGATPRVVAGSVLRHAMLPVALGLCVGLVAAIAGGRVVRAMLFEVNPVDPITLSLVTVVLLIVGLFACYLPARRAMRVDPLTALRTE